MFCFVEEGHILSVKFFVLLLENRSDWYSSKERHSIAPHSDQEDPLVSGSPIFSFSMGGTRFFELVPKTTGGAVPGTRVKETLEMRDGDLLVMGGTCA